jgi:hypothetical protein
VVLLGEGGELGVGQPWTEQQQGLTPEVEQRLHRTTLVARACQGADDEVVATLVGGGLEVLEQLAVEGAAHVHRHPEQLRAPPCQQARGPVGAVAELARRVEHGLPRGGAGSRPSPEDERHRGGADTGPGGDVLEAGTRGTGRHTAPSGDCVVQDSGQIVRTKC